jgi:hypothetical protein
VINPCCAGSEHDIAGGGNATGWSYSSFVFREYHSGTLNLHSFDAWAQAQLDDWVRMEPRERYVLRIGTAASPSLTTPGPC